MDNAADRKSVRAKEKAARLDARERQDVLREVMSTTQGRKWLWDHLATCHIYTTTFTGDALSSAFQEGERNVGQRLLSDIMVACPDQYIQAMREANERHIRDDSPATAERRRSAEPDGGDTGREDGAEANFDYDPYSDNGTDTRTNY